MVKKNVSEMEEISPEAEVKMPEATEKASKKEVSSKKTSKKSELSEKKVSKTSGNEDEQVLDVEVPEEKPKKTKQEKEVWGILHLYSSYNNTHLHVTDVTGSETIVKATGGMVTKSDRLKATPNVAMAAAKLVAEGCKNAGVTSLYVKLRAVGGHNGPMTPGPGSQATIRMLTRYGIKLGRIEDVTPVPHDSCRKKGGKRGRRV